MKETIEMFQNKTEEGDSKLTLVVYNISDKTKNTLAKDILGDISSIKNDEVTDHSPETKVPKVKSGTEILFAEMRKEYIQTHGIVKYVQLLAAIYKNAKDSQVYKELKSAMSMVNKSTDRNILQGAIFAIKDFPIPFSTMVQLCKQKGIGNDFTVNTPEYQQAVINALGLADDDLLHMVIKHIIGKEI